MNKTLKNTILTLAITSAVNYFAIAWFGFDVIQYLIGDLDNLARFIYTIFGTAVIIALCKKE